MARAATTSDVFNAIAEPQRREILVLLRAGERPVLPDAAAAFVIKPDGYRIEAHGDQSPSRPVPSKISERQRFCEVAPQRR